ncbi:MAG: KpsF/GutQ family sugar-phosphate isomerase [Bdellovibrionales bacterium]|nr:KpsF/GutQ family sugar-phosphate isomerase [Bdellovibrionales bacterium]
MSSLDIVKDVLLKEADEILRISKNLGDEVDAAVDLILSCQGRVILSGLGKSGHIALKISSTLSSLGTPSFFVHPTECSHGDLGMISTQDILLILSNSGNSYELKDVLNYASRNSVPVIAMTGNSESDLAKAARVVFNTKVSAEACPFGLAPTTSTTVCLALGDALAVALLKKRDFSKEQYAQYHPGGVLGRRLLTRVKDVMHTGDTFPLVKSNTSMRDVITKMTAKEVRGVAGIIDDKGNLVGVITDGDLRRRLEKSNDPLGEVAKDVMSHKPKTIFEDELAEKALFIMEEFMIQTLFVLQENTNKPVGLLHLQDLLKAKLR